MRFEFRVVHELEMLTEVIFSVEGAFLLRLFLAGEEVVGFKMLRGGIELVAEDAVGAACGWDGDGGNVVWTAGPSFEGQMERFLVSLPVILGGEGVCAESALEYAGRSRLCLLSCDSLCHWSTATATAL